MRYFILFDQYCKLEWELIREIYKKYPDVSYLKSISDMKEKGVIFRWGIRIEDKDTLEKELNKPYTRTQIYLEGHIVLYIPDTTAQTNRMLEKALGVRFHSYLKQPDVLCEEEMKERMKRLAEEWRGYRFGDCFVHPHWDDWNTGDQTKLNEYLYKTYPNSLISQYSVRNKFKAEQNPKLLREIVESQSIFEKEIPCVGIHLRCGDVLLKKTVHQEQRYVPPSVYGTIGKTLKENGLKKVCLVFGLHYYYENVANLTLAYVRDVASRLKQHGIEVRYRVGTPDEDVMFMSSVKYLIPAKSHYSLVVAKELARGKVMQCFKSGLKYEHGIKMG